MTEKAANKAETPAPAESTEAQAPVDSGELKERKDASGRVLYPWEVDPADRRAATSETESKAEPEARPNFDS